MSGSPADLPMVPAAAPRSAGISRGEWLGLARWARWLSWSSLGYMAVEGAIGVAAGVAASSIALVGFGIDSAIEGFASLVIVWRFTGARLHSHGAEERARRLVAIQFFLLAPYITVQAIRDLAGGAHPDGSWVGIGLAISSIVVMPVLGVAKQRIGRRMGSVATQGEGAQNLLCAYMAAALLVGLAGNALFGLWWLDPAAALAIAGLAVREGLEAWRGESCCIPSATGACDDDCRTPSRAASELPITECRLDLPQLRAQADRYRRLGATATRIESRDGTLTATFDAEFDERLLIDAIAVEHECCPFFSFDYDPGARRVAITVERPDQRPALEALYYAFTGREAPANAGASCSADVSRSAGSGRGRAPAGSG